MRIIGYRSTRHQYKYNGGLNVKLSIQVIFRVSDRFSVWYLWICVYNVDVDVENSRRQLPL